MATTKCYSDCKKTLWLMYLEPSETHSAIVLCRHALGSFLGSPAPVNEFFKPFDLHSNRPIASEEDCIRLDSTSIIWRSDVCVFPHTI